MLKDMGFKVSCPNGRLTVKTLRSEMFGNRESVWTLIYHKRYRTFYARYYVDGKLKRSDSIYYDIKPFGTIREPVNENVIRHAFDEIILSIVCTLLNRAAQLQEYPSIGEFISNRFIFGFCSVGALYDAIHFEKFQKDRCCLELRQALSKFIENLWDYVWVNHRSYFIEPPWDVHTTYKKHKEDDKDD